MLKNMMSSHRKPISFVLLAGVCLILAALTLVCRTFPSQSPPQRSTPSTLPASFPATDIVYKAGDNVGFVNADGSGKTAVPFSLPFTDFVSSWASPVITGDQETLIVTATSTYPGAPGKILVARAGGVVAECQWSGIARLAADGRHIWLETLNGQEEYLTEDCGTKNPAKKSYPGVFGALSPDEQYSAEGKWVDAGGAKKANIILHDLGTGKERVIATGDFPVWSSDGQWLAYTGGDGLYIVQNSPDAKPRLLVPLRSSQSMAGPVYNNYPPDQYFPPIASWSPDGKWLVYHVYNRTPVSNSGYAEKYYSIFKVNVDTGETTKLLDGGYSPSWRWPAEEP